MFKFNLKEYAPIILIVLVFFIQFNIFWKPEQIQAFASENFVSKTEFKMLYDEMKYIRQKVDDIYKKMN